MSKKILIAPLDWGLGHATRCIPVIQAFSDRGCEVILGGEGGVLDLLRLEFPNLSYERMGGYDIAYPKSGSMTLKMMLSAPRILQRIRMEQTLLEEIVTKRDLDAVVSDNRYGLHHQSIPSVFISHQLFIKTPLLEKTVQKMQAQFIEKFDRCWIPDHAGTENLSGELSHAGELPRGATFVGPLTRMKAPSEPRQKDMDVLVIVSGPEPQRSLFEEQLTKAMKAVKGKCLLVRGKPSEDTMSVDGNLTVVSHLSGTDLEDHINRARLVVCRSGYSSIMDLSALGKKALLIPTPGQTEQEYLASLHGGAGRCLTTTQGDLDLNDSLDRLHEISGLSILDAGDALGKAVDEFINEL